MALPSWLSDFGSAASSLTSGLGLLQGLGSLFGIGSGPSYEEQLAQQWLYSQKAMMLQYQNQLGLQHDSQKFNSLQAKQANELQERLLKLQQYWQSSEWSRQFNAQNAYNSPTAMSKRLSNAGFNPSALIGNGMPSVGSTMGPVASAPSAPVVHSAQSSAGSASALGVTPSYYDFTVKRRESLLAMQEIAKTAKELGYADERSRAEIDSLWANIAKTNSDERLQNVLASNAEIEVELKRVHGHSKMKAEINNLIMQGYLAASSGDLNVMRTVTEQLEQSIKSEEFKKICLENKSLPALLAGQISALRASADASRASAEHSRAQAETEDVLREHRRQSIAMDNEIKRPEAEFSIMFKEGRINQFRAAMSADKSLSDSKKKELDIRLSRLQKLYDDRRMSKFNEELDQTLWYIKENAPSLIDIVPK